MPESLTSAEIFSNDSAMLEKELLRHNRHWEQQLRNAAAYIPAPIWSSNTILNPEKNALTDTFLPWDEISSSLRRLGHALFNDDQYIPRLLQSRRDCCGFMQQRYCLDSVLEFWQMMPDFLAGRLRYDREDLLPLFCALADPDRFGTAAERYPEQLRLFRKLLQQTDAVPLQVLDLGCGIGLGTLEIADMLRQAGRESEVTGVTIEPLEIWMAVSRRLPHHPEKEKAFRAFSENLPCRFIIGNAESYRDSRQYHFIFCNGLAGGRFLNRSDQLQHFLDSLEALLLPQGKVLLANHFHPGFRPGLEKLMDLGAAMNFNISGTPDNLLLQKR